MRKLFVFVLVCSIVASCSLFKSKTTLLTEHEWLLYKRIEVDEQGKNSIKYFKKVDTIHLKFEEDGSLTVTSNGKSKEYGLWQWTEDSKGIHLSSSIYGGILEVKELGSDTFSWRIIREDNNKLISEEFKIESSKDWNDKVVDTLNRFLNLN